MEWSDVGRPKEMGPAVLLPMEPREEKSLPSILNQSAARPTEPPAAAEGRVFRL